MVFLVSIHPVQDYDVWKAQLDDHRRALGRAGVTRHWLYRGADDPNEVMTVFELPSLEAAGRFLRSAEVGVADWMDRAGLEETVEPASRRLRISTVTFMPGV